MADHSEFRMVQQQHADCGSLEPAPSHPGSRKGLANSCCQRSRILATLWSSRSITARAVHLLLNMEGKLQKDIMQSALMLGYVSLKPEQLDVAVEGNGRVCCVAYRLRENTLFLSVIHKLDSSVFIASFSYLFLSCKLSPQRTQTSMLIHIRSFIIINNFY